MGWWANKLQQSRATGLPAVPAPVSPPTAPQQVQEQPAMPVNEAGQIDAGTGIRSWRGGKGNKAAGNCPECGGGNYWEIPARGTYVPKCFDCGIIEQFGSDHGVGGAQQKLNPNSREVAGQARQPASFYTGAHTNEIIAKVQ